MCWQQYIFARPAPTGLPPPGVGQTGVEALATAQLRQNVTRHPSGSRALLEPSADGGLPLAVKPAWAVSWLGLTLVRSGPELPAAGLHCMHLVISPFLNTLIEGVRAVISTSNGKGSAPGASGRGNCARRWHLRLRGSLRRLAGDVLRPATLSGSVVASPPPGIITACRAAAICT